MNPGPPTYEPGVLTVRNDKHKHYCDLKLINFLRYVAVINITDM